MNQKYLNHTRKQVSRQAKYLLVVQSAILIILIGLIVRSITNEEILMRLLFFAVPIALPICFLGLALFISTKKNVCVDLFGIAYFTGYVVAFMFLILGSWIKVDS